MRPCNGNDKNVVLYFGIFVHFLFKQCILFQIFSTEVFNTYNYLKILFAFSSLRDTCKTWLNTLSVFNIDVVQ